MSNGTPEPDASTSEPLLPVYMNCGCCGHLHRVAYTGDCRNDAERFTFDTLDAKHGQDGWIEGNDPE